ncbi:hypothetical protein ACFVGY_06880 [Streptomyces sp. NPDC127106]|uniref:hypothetical protein n=1 Tax=Streptomyces sp. NPDC127106 TaxID=3345360 RepID=UPI00363EF500
MSNDGVFLPWGVVTTDFWTTPATSHTPPTPTAATPPPPPPPPPPGPPNEVDVPARIAAVAALAREGDLDEAVLLAERLDTEHTAATNENFSTATADIREVRGYLASLTGDHRTAVGWYLHALRLRADLHGPDHPDTEAAVHRAYSLWRTTTDPVLGDRLGNELLTTVISIQGPHSAAARRIHEALDHAADP